MDWLDIVEHALAADHEIYLEMMLQVKLAGAKFIR
jgi:hypothetical protein